MLYFAENLSIRYRFCSTSAPTIMSYDGPKNRISCGFRHKFFEYIKYGIRPYELSYIGKSDKMALAKTSRIKLSFRLENIPFHEVLS